MLTVKQLPPHAVQMARDAMAEALARDGDGIPECIVACINHWEGAVRNYNWDGSRSRIILPFNTEPSND